VEYRSDDSSGHSANLALKCQFLIYVQYDDSPIRKNGTFLKRPSKLLTTVNVIAGTNVVDH